MHTSVRFACLAAFFVTAACGDGGSSGQEPEGSSSPQEKTPGAGPTDGPVTLPSNLPQCSDTPDPMDAGPVFATASVGGAAVQLGQGIRGGKLVVGGNMMTPGTSEVRDQNLGFFADNDANWNISDFFKSFYTDTPSLMASHAAGESASRAFKEQGDLSTIDQTKEIYWRVITEQSATEVLGSNFKAAANRPAPQAKDEYVSAITLAQVFSSIVRFHFTKDSACHIRAIHTIMNQAKATSSLSLKEILKSPHRPQIELYLKTVAPIAARSLGALVSNNPQGEEELRNEFMTTKCTLQDLPACEALMAKVENVAAEQGKVAAAAKIKASDLGPSGVLPRGWIPGKLTRAALP